MTLALNVALIPSLGASGAALASTLSYGAATSFLVWAFVRRSELELAQLLRPTRADVSLAAALVRRLAAVVRPPTRREAQAG